MGVRFNLHCLLSAVPHRVQLELFIEHLFFYLRYSGSAASCDSVTSLNFFLCMWYFSPSSPRKTMLSGESQLQLARAQLCKAV